MIFFYRPQSSCGKVMFLQLSVILFPPRQTPPRQTPSWADIPGQTPPGRHPPPREMATAADGTHPTGMYSCCDIIFLAHIYRPLTKLREGNVFSHSVPPYPLLALTHSPEASESEVRASENFDPLARWG